MSVLLNVRKTVCMCGHLRILDLHAVCAFRQPLTAVAVRHYAYQLPEQMKTRFKHPYRQMYNWKTRAEFTDYIYKQIVYNANGLIVLNKPYGVPKERYKKKGDENSEKTTTMQTLASMAGGEAGYGLMDAIPGLRILLDTEYLEIMKCSERFTSGITILASDENAHKSIQKSLRRARGLHVPLQSFWVVVNGVPSPPAKKESVGLTLEFVDLVAHGQSVDKQPVILHKFSKKAVTEGKVLKTDMEYKTIKDNHEIGASLVEISTNRTKSHLVRVYAAHKALSILGDGMYGSRVKHVLGKSIVVSHNNASAYDPQKLPESWHKLLKTNERNINLIPTHIHQHKIFLPKLFNKEDVLITAPPPHHFLWTCAQLGLIHPSEQESGNVQEPGVCNIEGGNVHESGACNIAAGSSADTRHSEQSSVG